jgi:hypothetical protein
MYPVLPIPISVSVKAENRTTVYSMLRFLNANVTQSHVVRIGSLDVCACVRATDDLLYEVVYRFQVHPPIVDCFTQKAEPFVHVVLTTAGHSRLDTWVDDLANAQTALRALSVELTV